MQTKLITLMNSAKSLRLFDSEWYQQQHRLKFSSEAEAFADYIRKGWFSDISPSQKFDNTSYLNINHDVYESCLVPLLHFLENGAEEGRQKRSLRELWRPKSEYIPKKNLNRTGKYAVVLHIFYDDFVNIFAEALSGVDFDFDLFITTPSASIIAHSEHIFKDNLRVRKITAHLVPNKGRNFPFLVEFGSVLLEYDFFCHLHSKKSLHAGSTQTHWATYLVEYLINDKQILGQALDILEANENLGLYYPVSYWRMPTWVNHWLKNKRQGLDFLRDEIGVSSSPDFFAYPVGGMFWARPKALKLLLERAWCYEDFPDEPLPADGTLLHVLERSMPFYCQKENYKQLFYTPSTGQFTDDDSFIFKPYSSDGFQHIRDASSSADIISFDLFDTLVKRSFYEPDYAKSIVPSRLGLPMKGEDYVALRNSAETSLRRRNGWTGDVDIYQICKEMSEIAGLECDPNLLAQTEFEIDLEMIQGKHLMVDLLNLKSREGKIIYVVTDTYYTKQQVQQILDRAGVECECVLYVSSDLKLRKDNSSMWRHMSDHLISIDMKEKFIHIGDNVCSDAQNPGDLGLRHIHILAPLDKWLALKMPNIQNMMNIRDPSMIVKWGPLLAQVGENPFLN
jgi:FMN phosphatase YigB (HAD superfamily)